MTRSLFLLGLAACGSSPATTPDAADTWTPLVTRSWSLAAGATDTYRCTRIQVSQDMYITGFRALAPLGTHHTVVTVSDTGGQLGDYDCTVGSLDREMLYASGVGSDDLFTPDGVGIRVRAGQYINLNLHLFNASDHAITGESGTLVHLVPVDQVQQVADVTFAGTTQFSIDPGVHDVQGGCTVQNDYTLFALWPHMHQLATHQTVTITHAGAPATLLDTDYAFSEQRYYPQAQPVAVHAGDQLAITCRYDNTTNHAVTFGDSSNDEMCFTGLFRYPAPAAPFYLECGH